LIYNDLRTILFIKNLGSAFKVSKSFCLTAYQLLEVLRDMDHPQVELALLKSCLGFPKFNFALRTCPPSKLRKTIARYDDLIQRSLFTIVGSHMPQQAREQVAISCSMGGLGVTSATQIAEAAFIASVLETKQLRADISGKELQVPGFDEALLSLAEKLPGKLHDELTFTAISIGKLQKKLS